MYTYTFNNCYEDSVVDSLGFWRNILYHIVRQYAFNVTRMKQIIELHKVNYYTIKTSEYFKEWTVRKSGILCLIFCVAYWLVFWAKSYFEVVSKQ